MSLRVLLTDPERAQTNMYRLALSAYGFEVAVAHTGPDCLAALRAFRPAILVMDPELPWRQAEEVLARLGVEAGVPRLPVLLLCATYRPEYREALAGLPAADCFQKPVLPHQLATRIQILLDCLSPYQPPADLTGPPTVDQEGLAGHDLPAGGRLRVLIVDDARDTADTLCLLLQRAGHEVTVAYASAAALTAARQMRPDVVLCDLGRSGLYRLEIAAALRADPLTAGARLIAVSGYGQEEDVRRSLEAGFELHLAKPVDPEDWPRLLAQGRKAAPESSPGQPSGGPTPAG
jgi:CheY-like chemotaxis protein